MMRINNVNKVCDVFLPNEERPVNCDFDFLGETFCICTYQYMRGPFGLHGCETPQGYFVICASKWLDFDIDVFPERNECWIICEIKKRAAKGMTAEEVKEHKQKAEKIKAAFVRAIIPGTAIKLVEYADKKQKARRMYELSTAQENGA